MSPDPRGLARPCKDLQGLVRPWKGIWHTGITLYAVIIFTEIRRFQKIRGFPK
jgi:hypothetical protein